jgi:predicted dehydrogenase
MTPGAHSDPEAVAQSGPVASHAGSAGRRAGDRPAPLRVAVVGCGLVGAKRSAALVQAGDELVACYDVDARATGLLARRHGCRPCKTLTELLDRRPQIVVVATVHDRLAELAELALAAGAHVLVEKPAGVCGAQIDRLIESRDACRRLVKVGFNHRFHPGLARAAEEVRSGRHGELLHLRGRYGHGGRLGYEREWRCDPARSGGGELIDQGMHLLDLSSWLAGPLALHAALLHTEFWDTPVEDNAALLLGDARSRSGPWALLHVSWTEWKNLFSLELFCRRAKLQVDGLAGSYGPQRLRIYRMSPELGPPELEELSYPDEDGSWRREWEHFTAAVRADDGRALLGDLHSARYAWTQIEAAYAANPQIVDAATVRRGAGDPAAVGIPG